MSDILDKVREKYPAYENVPDDDLTFALANKYPQYLKADKDFASDFDRVSQIKARPQQVDAALGEFNQLHPDVFQGPPMPSPADSLGAATPPRVQTPLTVQPGAITGLPQAPSGLDYFLGEPRRNTPTLNDVLAGGGTPIEARPGIDYPRMDRPDNLSPLEALQKPTEMPAPRVTAQQIPKFVPRPVAKVAAGVEQAAAGLADFFTSGAGVLTVMTGGIAGEGLAAPKILARLGIEGGEDAYAIGSGLSKGINRAFTGDMIRGAPEQLRRFGNAMADGDTEGATREFLNGLVQAAIIGHGAKSAVRDVVRARVDAAIKRRAARDQQPQAEGEAQPVESARVVRMTDEEHAAAEQQAIAEAQKHGSPLKIVDRFEGEAEGIPFARTVALSGAGGIELNRAEFRKNLERVAPERRAQYIQSLIGEEHIHRNVSDADAASYWNTLTAAEKAGEIRQYAGPGIWTRKKLGAYLERDLSDSQLGHEAVRRRVQKLLGQTPTEVAESALRERWTIQTIDALSSAIRKSRELLDTSASEEGRRIVDVAEKNLAAARAAVQASKPPSSDDLLKMTPQEVVDWKKAVKYGPATSKSIADTLSREQVQKLKDESEKLAQQSKDMLGKLKSPDDPGMAEAQNISLKAQTLREIGEDWDAENEPFSIRRRQRDESTPPLPLVAGGGERVTAEEMGASKFVPKRPFNEEEINRTAYEHLQNETDRITAEAEAGKRSKPISFDRFSNALKAEFGDIQPGKVYDSFSDNLYKRLLNASGKTLEALQRSLGIAAKGRIMDPKAEEGFSLKGETASSAAADIEGARRRISDAKKILDQFTEPDRKRADVRAKMSAAQAVIDQAKDEIESRSAQTRAARLLPEDARRRLESGQKYRRGAIRIIADKLLAEAREASDKKPNRSTISIEDLSNEPDAGEGSDIEDVLYKGVSKEPVFFDIAADDLRTPRRLEKLAERLTADSRRSNRDPVSLTKRVTALLDKQTGKVYLVSTYPHGRSGAMLVDPSLSQVRNHRPLTELLNRYRPVASMLLDEPVRGFRQSFDSLGDFERKLATDARRGVQDVGEAPLAEGQQEAPGSRDVGAPITDAEATSIFDHIFAESGTFEGPEDVQASLAALKEDTNFQVLSGYTKLAADIEAKNPDFTPKQVLEQLAKNIYENFSQADRTATPVETFVRRTMEQGGAKNRQAPEAGPAPATGKELTMPIERRPPTDVRPENIPAEEAAKLRTKPAPPVPEGSLVAATSDPASIARNIRDIADDVKAMGDAVRYTFTANPTEDLIARKYDDSHNSPANRASEVGARIRMASTQKATKLEAFFSLKGNEKRLAAANVLVKSGALRTRGVVDVGLLQTKIAEFQDLVRQGTRDAVRMQRSASLFDRRRGRIKMRAAKQLKQELDYAQANMTDPNLIKTAERAHAAGESIYNQMRAAGIDIAHRDNYIPGRYDISGTDGRSWIFREPKIIGTKFRDAAVFNNPYEAIAAPDTVFVPATRDVASLMEHATRRGLELIEKQQFKEFVKMQTTPDGLPVAVDADLSPTSRMFTAPRGYADYEVVPQTGLAVHPRFASTVRNLTTPSIIEDMPVTRAILHFEQFLKHNMLIGDFFHLGRIAFYGASIMRGQMGFKRGWGALQFAEADVNEAVRKGLLTQKQADWGREQLPFGYRTVTRGGVATRVPNLITRRELLKLAQTGAVGFNVGKIQDALYKDVFTQLTPTSGPIKRAIAKITDPTTGRYNRLLFDKLTRGLMGESLVTEFERQMKSHPDANPMTLLRDISRDLNNYYGNIGRQGWLKSKSHQDMARMLFLAPQWVEGLVKKEVIGGLRLTGASKLTGQRQGKSFLGTTGAGMGTGLLFMFGLTQVINAITRGKSTFQNEEKGHGLDAYIPIGGGRDEGLWLSPLSLFAEISHDVWRLTHSKPSFMQAIDQIAGNKESPILRATLIAAFGQDPMGRRFTTTGGQLKEAGKALIPVPLTFGRYGQALGHTVAPSVFPPVTRQALARQAFSTLGFKTEPSDSASQQISRMADDFMAEKGYKKDTGYTQVPLAEEASYTKLRGQLRNGDQSGAAKTYQQLLRGRKEGDIIKAMKVWAHHPVTGSKTHENEFVTELSDAQLNQYTKAQDEKLRMLEDFYDFVSRQP